MMRPADFIILLLGTGLVAGLGAYTYSGGEARVVQVSGAGHADRDYPAWQARRLEVDGPLGATVIEIRDGQARITASPCRRKVCMRAGWLGSAGEATACVPNRVAVALLGNDPRFDAMNF